MERTGQKHHVERLARAALLHKRYIVNHDELGIAALQRLTQATDCSLSAVSATGKRSGNRLHGALRADNGATGCKIGQATGGLSGLKGNDEIGCRTVEQRSGDVFSPIAHAHVAHNRPAALGHADGLGRAHLPSAAARRLGHELCRQNRALASDAGDEDVKHGRPPLHLLHRDA